MFYLQTLNLARLFVHDVEYEEKKNKREFLK